MSVGSQARKYIRYRVKNQWRWMDDEQVFFKGTS